MKSIIFDTGPIISLATNNLLWILEPLKKKFNGKFYITPEVKKELIDKALKTKRFEFEALQVYDLIENNVLEIIDNKKIRDTADRLMYIANRSFKAKGNYIKLVHDAEIETLAADAVLNSDAVVIDERTARILLENTPKLTNLLESKLKSKIQYNKDYIKEFKKILKDVQIIRSTELAIVAYNMGLFKKYLLDIGNVDPKKRLLDAILWAIKVRGCSVSQEEIKKAIKQEA